MNRCMQCRCRLAGTFRDHRIAQPYQCLHQQVEILAAGAVSGHHSTAAFDTTRVVKIEGTVTQFRWINPHASIKVCRSCRLRRPRRRVPVALRPDWVVAVSSKTAVEPPRGTNGTNVLQTPVLEQLLKSNGGPDT